MKTEKLAEVTRGEVMESVHRGVIAVVDTQGEVIASLGDRNIVPIFVLPPNLFRLYQLLKAGQR